MQQTQVVKKRPHILIRNLLAIPCFPASLAPVRTPLCHTLVQIFGIRPDLDTTSAVQHKYAGDCRPHLHAVVAGFGIEATDLLQTLAADQNRRIATRAARVSPDGPISEDLDFRKFLRVRRHILLRRRTRRHRRNHHRSEMACRTQGRGQQESHDRSEPRELRPYR